jgi:7,8-dihydropterin-6-yl-methyl-4-(beta-D-ribofuranosyl)aminobenzene 5'-phosphate synthase
MFDLTPVDKLEVQILIDDVTDPLSSVPDYAESDLGYLMRKGKMPVMAAKCLCSALGGFWHFSEVTPAFDGRSRF